MVPFGWTGFNSVAAFFPEGFESAQQGQSLFAWIVKSEGEVQSWLVEDSGWDGTIYDAEPVDTAGFIEKVACLFNLPRKVSLPDLDWVTNGWIVYEGSDEVSVVGEGMGQWLIVHYTSGRNTAES